MKEQLLKMTNLETYEKTLEQKIKEVESLINHIEEGKKSGDYFEDELNLELDILKNQLFILNTLNSLTQLT